MRSEHLVDLSLRFWKQSTFFETILSPIVIILWTNARVSILGGPLVRGSLIPRCWMRYKEKIYKKSCRVAKITCYTNIFCIQVVQKKLSLWEYIFLIIIPMFLYRNGLSIKFCFRCAFFILTPVVVLPRYKEFTETFVKFVYPEMR